MITRNEVLTKWFRQWHTLKAWRRDLSNVTMEVSDRQYSDRLGTCWPAEQRFAVYRGHTPKFFAPGELYTVLHEMAHAACIEEHHGSKWQEAHAAAIREVTGIEIPKAANNYHTLCEAGTSAMKSWWVSSGNEFLLRLTGVEK